MQSTLVKIDSINKKLRQVIRKMELVRKENKLLTEENVKLKKTLENIKAAQRGNEGIDVKNELSKENEEKIRHVKKELDFYISEIDKCVSILKN